MQVCTQAAFSRSCACPACALRNHHHSVHARPPMQSAACAAKAAHKPGPSASAPAAGGSSTRQRLPAASSRPRTAPREGCRAGYSGRLPFRRVPGGSALAPLGRRRRRGEERGGYAAHQPDGDGAERQHLSRRVRKTRRGRGRGVGHDESAEARRAAHRTRALALHSESDALVRARQPMPSRSAARAGSAREASRWGQRVRESTPAVTTQLLMDRLLGRASSTLASRRCRRPTQSCTAPASTHSSRVAG